MDRVLQRLGSFWDLVLDRWQTHAALETGYIVIAAAVAAVLVCMPVLWRVSRQAVTIVHEMGHAITARAVGRRVEGMKLHSDTSGVLFSRGRPRGPGVLLTMLAGYPAPSIFAALMAVAAGFGYAGAALTVYQLVLLAGVWLAVNLMGLFSVIASLLVTGVIWWFGDDELITFTVVLLAVFYAAGGIRTTIDVIMVHARSEQPEQLSTDAAQASSSMTLSPPAGFWLGVFVLCAMIGAATVAEWLIFGIEAPGFGCLEDFELNCVQRNS